MGEEHTFGSVSIGQSTILGLSPDETSLVLGSPPGYSDPPHSQSTTSSIKLDSIAFIKHRSGAQDETAPELTLHFFSSAIPSSEGELSLPQLRMIILALPPDPDTLNHPKIAPLVLPRGSPHLDVILNNHAGARQAKVVCEGLVQRVLSAAGASWRVWETEREGDAGVIARRLVNNGDRKLLLAGGDGTVGEVVNGLLVDEAGEAGEVGKVDGVELVLVPLGTANALYHHLFPPESLPHNSPLALLHSLLAYLRRSSTPAPLPLALNTFPSRSATTPPQKPIITTVVSSCALHAALLYDAEALRSTHPGVERFKLAAVANVSTWWSGTLALKGKSQRYDPETKGWVELDEEDQRELKGPAAYLVSALVSRFEQNFIVAPHRSPLSPLAPSTSTVDLVLIRPLRNSKTAAEWAEAGGDKEKRKAVREEFVAKVWEVTGGMYGGGTHVDFSYAEEEGGQSVVEYLRAEAFEWKPAPSDAIKDNLFCLDGLLKDLGNGGRASVRALGAEFGVAVWA